MVKNSREGAIVANWFVKALIVCLFVGLSSVGYLWQKSQVHRLGQQIRTLEKELDRLEKSNETLRQRYSTLMSQSELRRRVKEYDLKLREPAPEQILRIKDAPKEEQRVASGKPKAKVQPRAAGQGAEMFGMKQAKP